MKQAVVLAFLIALSAQPMVAQSFRPDDPLKVDNDTAINVKDVAKHKLSDYYDFFQNTFKKPGDRTSRSAVNINTLGEVPDSSWFQNRHGAVRMSADELAQGPNAGSGPSVDGPWTVIGAKTEGITPGFRIRDSRGDVYLLKFDPPRNREMATAAEVISTKFFYAFGYNVPENYLTSFTRSQLRVDPKATLVDAAGHKRNFKESDLDAILKSIHRLEDGSYRVLASKFLSGTPVGPFTYHGTRPDDPNDIFPHEHRRELRGLRVFSAWLNHDDSRAINSLDTLVEKDGRRFVRHHLIDFGSTLGSGSTGAQTYRAGWEYIWEPASALQRIVTFGLWDRKWPRVTYPDYESIGRFEGVHFDPETWRPEYPNPAFSNMQDEDAYWAAKIVMAFSDDDIRAIVKTGQLSNGEAEEYLIQTLITRRDKIGRHWLSRVSSFDRFEVVDGGLRFEHLASKYGCAPRPEVSTAWFSVDPVTGARNPLNGAGALKSEGYVLAQLTSAEGRVDVYIRNANGRTEIVGVER